MAGAFPQWRLGRLRFYLTGIFAPDWRQRIDRWNADPGITFVITVLALAVVIFTVMMLLVFVTVWLALLSFQHLAIAYAVLSVSSSAVFVVWGYGRA